MGSEQGIKRSVLVDRCCNGVCFGFGFAVIAITLIAMFWLVWFYFGLTIVQVSNSQRRALVDYSYVPPTSSPNLNTEVPESSINQISKHATVSSSFPKIDPSEVLEKKKEILNERSGNTAKGDFALRSRNKTGETERKPTDEDDDIHAPKESSLIHNDKDIDGSMKNDGLTETQQGDGINISSNSESSILSTEVIKSEFKNEKTTNQGSTSEKISPSALSNSKIRDEDFPSRIPNVGNSRDMQPKRDDEERRYSDRDDSSVREKIRGYRDRNINLDDKMSKGDTRIIPDSQQMGDNRPRDRDRDEKLPDSNTRRRGDIDRYDEREDRYQNRAPPVDRQPLERKREADKYMPTASRNDRNRDRIIEEDKIVDDRRERRRGDTENYDDKPFEHRNRDRTTIDKTYIDESRKDAGRDRRLSRDRSRVDDEYYPNEERRTIDDFQDRPSREYSYRDRIPEDDKRYVGYRNEESREDRRYPTESRNNDRISGRRYRDETRKYDDRLRNYDTRKANDDEYRYKDRTDRIRPNQTRSRYDYPVRSIDYSRYDSMEDSYRGDSYDENSRAETRRDSLKSSRTDYRPIFEETKLTRLIESTRNDQRYLDSSSRGDNLGIGNRERGITKDEETDKYPRQNGRDGIAPTRVKDDRYITREIFDDTYEPYERRVVGSYPDNTRTSVIETKYQYDERSRAPQPKMESSSPRDRKEYYPRDEIKNSPRSEKDGISLERRLYSSEDDGYRLSNTNTRSRANQPESIPYDDRRRDYRSDETNKKYDEDEYERRRRTNLRNRDSLMDNDRYDRDKNEDDRYRDSSDRDRYYRDRGRPIDREGAIKRDESKQEQDRYNPNRDRINDEDKYRRNRDRYDDEEKYTRNRDRYDYRYTEDRYEKNRDGYDDEDRYEDDRYIRNRYRYDDGGYDRGKGRYGDDADRETRRYDKNEARYDDDRYGEVIYDRPTEIRPRDELKPQDDRTSSRDASATRSRNTSPSRSDSQNPSYASRPAFKPADADDKGMDSKDTRRRETSVSPTSDYNVIKPINKLSNVGMQPIKVVHIFFTKNL